MYLCRWSHLTLEQFEHLTHLHYGAVFRDLLTLWLVSPSISRLPFDQEFVFWFRVKNFDQRVVFEPGAVA